MIALSSFVIQFLQAKLQNWLWLSMMDICSCKSANYVHRWRKVSSFAVLVCLVSRSHWLHTAMLNCKSSHIIFFILLKDHSKLIWYHLTNPLFIYFCLNTQCSKNWWTIWRPTINFDLLTCKEDENQLSCGFFKVLST